MSESVVGKPAGTATATTTVTTMGGPAGSSATMGSPKNKFRPQIPVTNTLPVAAYGCEHVQSLMKEHRKITIQQYSLLLQAIFEKNGLVRQTQRSGVGAGAGAEVCLVPTYLCLQCPNIHPPGLRDEHWQSKGHAFSVESRAGFLFCSNCHDFVYDPMLEEVRLQNGRKKRKLDDYALVADDVRLISQNSTFGPCRAIGLRGLYNMGQTCFMSVVIQSLIHNPFIRSFFLTEGHKPAECEKRHCTSCAFDELFTEFFSTEKTEGFGAVGILMSSWMGSDSLAGYRQQDAHEYLHFVLNALHSENCVAEQTLSPDCRCFIHQTFQGRLQSTVTCDRCKTVSTAVDPIIDLSLDIRPQPKKRKADPDTAVSGAVDLRDCLDRFTGKEKLVAGEWVCSKCQSGQSATKQLTIQRLPPVLIVHLKRFEHNKTSSKIDTVLNFPLTLDVFPYTSRARAGPTKPSAAVSASAAPTCLYDLSSVVVHKGGKIDSGHYVNYAKRDDRWFLFDDVKVVIASEQEVLAASGYMLFYVVRKLDMGVIDDMDGREGSQ